MTSFAELVGTIHSSLHSYTGLQEQMTHLTAPVTSSATTLSVADSAEIRKGIIEVDDELMYVTAADSGSLTVAPFGRGFRASTAAAHSANVAVVSDPAFPRVEIKRAINQTIDGLYPTLWAIQATELSDYTPVVGTYALPAGCEGVNEVMVLEPGDPTQTWVPLLAWSFNPTAADIDGGKAITINAQLVPGARVRVTYRTKFEHLVDDSNELFEWAGVPDSCADLILYAVAARMVRFLDPARIQVPSVENISRSQVVQAGDAGRLANQLYAMYQQRLAEERRKLLSTNPTRPNFSGR